MLAYRAYMAERRKHESLEFLHEVTRLLARAPDITAGISGLLQRTLDVFRGDLAEIILLPSDQRSEALRTTLEQGGTVEPMVLADRYVADALHALVDGDTPARLLERPLADPLLDAALARRGVQRAMLAALPGETRVVGTFLVANRSPVGSFDGHDLTLFGTLANHASVALEYDRLEHPVSQLRELQGRLEHQAFHDPLTGLANRALFLDRLGELLASGRRDYAVLFLDLDDFKTINDSLGHSVGDELLEAVAGRLRGALKAGDLAARLGGDEFAVLLHDVSDGDARAAASPTASSRCSSAPFAVAGHEISAHASLGIVEGWTAEVESAEELLRNADVAMYTAKDAGKQRHEVFEPAMHAAVLRRHRLKEDLQRAVERGELVVEYQPIVELATGNVAAAEALVRWNHPERGRMPPRRLHRRRRGDRPDPRGRPLRARARAAGSPRAGPRARPAPSPCTSTSPRASSSAPSSSAACPTRWTTHRPAAQPARPRDHRERPDARPARGRSGACRRCASSACAWRSTTSAPATRR